MAIRQNTKSGTAAKWLSWLVYYPPKIFQKEVYEQVLLIRYYSTLEQSVKGRNLLPATRQNPMPLTCCCFKKTANNAACSTRVSLRSLSLLAWWGYHNKSVPVMKATLNGGKCRQCEAFIKYIHHVVLTVTAVSILISERPILMPRAKQICAHNTYKHSISVIFLFATQYCFLSCQWIQNNIFPRSLIALTPHILYRFCILDFSWLKQTMLLVEKAKAVGPWALLKCSGYSAWTWTA